MGASFVWADKGENPFTGPVVNTLREGVLPPPLTDLDETPPLSLSVHDRAHGECAAVGAVNASTWTHVPICTMVRIGRE